MKTFHTKSILIVLILGIAIASHSQIITTIAGNYAYGYGYSGNGGQATAAELDEPKGVAVDAGGNIYIADNDNNVIRIVGNTNHIINNFLGNTATPINMCFSGDGGQAVTAELEGVILMLNEYANVRHANQVTKYFDNILLTSVC